MRNKCIFIVGGSIIIALLILLNREILNIIDISSRSVAYNSTMPIDVEFESLIIREDKEDAPSIQFKVSKINPTEPVQVANINSSKILSQNKFLIISL